MRHIIAGICIILTGLLYSCEFGKKDAVSTYKWIEGSWIRINNEEGQISYEHWNIEGDELNGLACTLEEGDTIFTEHMRIMSAGDSTIFRVIGVHDDPVDFVLQKSGRRSFEARCEENEFPKSIAYSLRRDTLYALVAGGELQLDFVFISKL